MKRINKKNIKRNKRGNILEKYKKKRHYITVRKTNIALKQKEMKRKRKI